jgi:hypothetical protein
LAADVAGYSRLMHNDEEATHAKLTALFADAVDVLQRQRRAAEKGGTGAGTRSNQLGEEDPGPPGLDQ